MEKKENKEEKNWENIERILRTLENQYPAMDSRNLFFQLNDSMKNKGENDESNKVVDFGRS